MKITEMIISTSLICSVLVVPKISFSAGSFETVFFLSDDLKSATKYQNTRYSNVLNKTYMNFNIDFNKNDIMYARPVNYTWTTDFYNNRNYAQLAFFNTNNYAYLQKIHDVNGIVSTMSDNNYKLFVDGSECLGDGCILDENIVSVVFPKKFRVKKYDANVRGNWKIVDNTYTFYSENVKGAGTTFEIEDTVPQIYVDLAKVLSKFSDIKVTYDGSNVHVIMPVEGVFKSGEANIQKNGEKWIGVFGNTMKNAVVKELRVEGHSDSAPINSKIYPSNWELSAARSAAVVRMLVKIGINPKLLASVGYADSRPVADNKTTETRQKNRRIEFTIVPELINTALHEKKESTTPPQADGV